MKENSTLISLILEKTLLTRIKEAASALGVSSSAYIRICVLQQLSKDEKLKQLDGKNEHGY